MRHHKFLQSIRYALTGLRIGWREEHNFQIEIVCALTVILLGIVLHLSLSEFTFILLTIGFVLVVEIINTALEELCDKFQPSHDPHIGRIKDLAAAAVFISSLAACVVGVIIFGSHLLEPIAAFDNYFENFLYSIRNLVIVDFFLLITKLGKVYVTFTVGGITALLLWLLQKRSYSVGLLTTFLGTAGSVIAIKFLLQRARPGELIPVHTELSYSFPSWHAAVSLALYGFLSYVMWKHSENRIWRHIFIYFGILIIILVGFSRLYLGVHYPSDIIGGYIFGGIWLVIGINLTKQLQNKK